MSPVDGHHGAQSSAYFSVLVAIAGRLLDRIVTTFATPTVPGLVTSIVSFAPALIARLRNAVSATVPCLPVIVAVLRGQPPTHLTVIVAPLGTPLRLSV